jgi:hypothetical protein
MPVPGVSDPRPQAAGGARGGWGGAAAGGGAGMVKPPGITHLQWEAQLQLEVRGVAVLYGDRTGESERLVVGLQAPLADGLRLNRKPCANGACRPMMAFQCCCIDTHASNKA